MNSSGLDFLTPSISLSGESSLKSQKNNNRLLKTNTSQDEIELLRMRSEYEKLYNFCQFGNDQKSELEAKFLMELKVNFKMNFLKFINNWN